MTTGRFPRKNERKNRTSLKENLVTAGAREFLFLSIFISEFRL